MREMENAASWTPLAKITVGALLAAWLIVAYAAGSSGILTAPAPQAFRPVLLSAVVPVALFLLIYAASPGLRAFVLAQSFRGLTQLQHWRVIGFGFLLLYAHDVLPGLFAWGAGLGDVLVGLTAPLVVLALERDPGFLRSGRFAAYHVLGLLDFALAVGVASLTSGAFPAILSGSLTSAPMEVWPLSIFPSFIVPIFIILHLSVFLKLQALRRPVSARIVPAPDHFYRADPLSLNR